MTEPDVTDVPEVHEDPGPGDEDVWQRFLDEFSQCGVVTEAAQAAGKTRMTFHRWRTQSARCREEFAEAEEQANDVLRKESRRRAVDD